MLYLTEGDYINAGLSALSIIPGADAFTKTGKASKVLGNGIVESGLKHLDNVADGIKKLVKKADDAIDLEKHLPKKLLKEEAETFAKKADKVADDVVEDAAKAIKSGLNSVDDIFTAGKKAFDNFDINNAYVKPKHLSTTGGNGQKFIGASKAEAESILKDALSNGKIVSISDNGLTKAGNASYEIIIDAGKTVGTKGENLVKIVISSDGGMLSAYPIK